MNYKIYTIPPFDNQLKRLANKYPSIKSEFASLIKSLETNPRQGISLGKNCFKIRMAIKSKGKGKRGGARVITNILIADKKVFLLAIYDKTDKELLSNKELIELLGLVSK